MMSNYKIRNMSKSEVKDFAIKWAAEEGWNPGLDDANTFYNSDPEGFYVGLLNDEPIASISIVSYGDQFAFLGLYIVKTKYRGQGYGLALWQHALEQHKHKNIGLDGVVDQQKNYRKSEFKFAYNNIRYEGKSRSYDIGANGIIEYNESDFDHVLAYDSRFFPVERKQFLKNWLTSSNTKTFIFKKDHKINGYICIRKCIQGYKIGPLFAESPEIAEALFKSANNAIPANELIYLDIPEPNKHANKLVEKYEMNKVFETARMYNQVEPNIDLDNIYGVTTFELG